MNLDRYTLKDLTRETITMNTYTQNLTFYDFIDVTKCKYILSLTQNDFKNIFWNTDEKTKDGKKFDLEYHYKSVKNLCERVLRDKSPVFVKLKQEYRYVNSKNGRKYNKLFGLQSCQKNIRTFLSKDLMLDIDIVNAHPCIFKKIINEYNETNEKIECNYLDEYITKRYKVLKSNDITKKQVLVCMNSDELKSDNLFLKNFHREKTAIFKTLLKSSIFTTQNITSDNKENPISSKINKLFCIYENEIISNVIKNDKHVVPCYDGFLFKTQNYSKYEYLLDADTNKTNLIKWTIKENPFDVDLSQFDSLNCTDYHSVKQRFEENHFRIRFPLLFIENDLNADNEYEDKFYPKGTDFMAINSSLKYVDEGEKSFMKRWMTDDDDIREYKEIGFYPYSGRDYTVPTHVYNTFKPFQCKYRQDYIDPKWFLDFIMEAMADNNRESYEWLMNYTAQFLQYPNKNIELIMVLKGEQGTGKDTYIKILEALVGKKNNYVRPSSYHELFDNFNSALKNTLLVLINEADGKDGCKFKEKLKDQCTSESNYINEKYMPTNHQKNYVQIIIASNNNSPVQYAHDERRFITFKMGEKYKQDNRYFGEIYRNIKNQDSLDHLYSYLMNRDISNWNPVTTRPITNSQKTAILFAVPTYIKYLNNVLERISQKIDIFGFHKCRNNVYAVMPSRLNDDYKSWAFENHEINIDNFNSKTLSKLLCEFKGIDWRVACKKKELDYNKELKKGIRYAKLDFTVIRNEIHPKYKFGMDDF